MSKKLELDPRWALGPRHAEIMAVLEKLAELTEDDFARLDEAYIFDPDTDDEEDNARVRVWGDEIAHAATTARGADWDERLHWRLVDALITQKMRYRNISTGAFYATREAALALTTRNLVGRRGYTQEHYDMLTAPWRVAIGPIHSEDRELTESDLPKYDY